MTGRLETPELHLISLRNDVTHNALRSHQNSLHSVSAKYLCVQCVLYRCFMQTQFQWRADNSIWTVTSNMQRYLQINFIYLQTVGFS